MSQHVALLLDLGVLKKLFAGFRGGQLPPPPFFSASYDHVVLGKNSPVLRPNRLEHTTIGRHFVLFQSPKL